MATGTVTPQEQKRKIIFKSHGSTTTLFKDLDPVQASVRVKALKRIYSDWCGQLVIIR